MAKNKSGKTDVETVHCLIPFTRYHEEATFDKESLLISGSKVPKERKGSHESGSFDYRLQSDDTTHDDIKTVVRSGHQDINMLRQYALNTLHQNSSSQTEHQEECGPMEPILNALPESHRTVSVQGQPNVHYMKDGENITCPTESLLSGCSTVSNAVQDPLENMTGEEVSDQNAQPPISSPTNDQVTLQTVANTLDLTVTEWNRDAMHMSMLNVSDINLYTRRHRSDKSDAYLQMCNNQVPRPHSYHGHEIRNKYSSASNLLNGSDQRKGYVRIRLSGDFSNVTSSKKSLTSSNASGISSKLEAPENGHVIKLHEELQFRSTLRVCISVTFTVISILLFFADWTADIFLARKYLNENDCTLFMVTVAFIIGPALVCAAADLYWFYHDHLNNLSDSCSQCDFHSEGHNTSEGVSRRESRVCMKYDFSSYDERVSSTGYREKEMLNKTRCKLQNSTREAYYKSKQDKLEQLTQNMSQDQSQEVEQVVCCTQRAISSHGAGQDKLNLYGDEHFHDNTNNFTLRFTHQKSQINTSKTPSDSEEDQYSLGSGRSDQPMKNAQDIGSNISQHKQLTCEEDQHFPEKLNINTRDKSTHSQDTYINSDDTFVLSQHQPINLHDNCINSQDKTPVCTNIQCQMKIHTSDFITTQPSACFHNSNVWVGFRIFVGILSFGRVFRSCEYIYHVIRSHQTGPNAIYHHLRALEEKRDYKLLDLIYAFTESAPQMFLQLYVVFIMNRPLKTEQVLSLVASVVGISWTVVSSYTHNKAALPEGRHLTLAAQALIFLARLGEISARIISIIFLEKSMEYSSLVLIIHFIIMLLWIQKQNPSLEGVAFSKHFRVLFKLFLSYVLVVCFINLKCNRSKYRMIFYYVLTYGENFVFAGLMLCGRPKILKMEEEEQNTIYWLAALPIGLILQVMFQIICYSCCYRNRKS